MPIASPLTDEQERVPLRFTVPEEFHELDLAESAEARVERTLARLRAALPGVTDEQCAHLVTNQETALSQLMSQGAVYAAVLAARSDANPEQLSFAQFSVLVQSVELPGRRPAHTLAGGLKTAESPRQVAVVEFPAGEGVVLAEDAAVTRPITVAGAPIQHTHRVRQAQVIFPRQSHNKLIILNLSTESLGDWDAYQTMLNGIARSVSFRDAREHSIFDRLTLGG